MPAVQFLIKPHPIEDLKYYRLRISTANLRNVRFAQSEYIWNVLKASDILLHRHCTTAVESWMWDKPTIEMGMDFVPQWAWAEREQGSDIAHTADQLISLVRHHLAKAVTDSARKAYRHDYIRRWFGPADGMRCAETGEIINAFLRERGFKRSYLHQIKGLSSSPKTALGAVLRYRLNCLPNQPLMRNAVAPLDEVASDKLITRSDVRAYRKRIAQARISCNEP
jgi:hypothetical protein